MSQSSCDRCGKHSSLTRLYQIRGSEVSEYWLCDVCGRDVGLEPHSPRFAASVGDLLGALVHNGEETACVSCGTTFEQIRHTGRVGCAECYRWYRRQIVELLGREELGTEHAGRLPRRLALVKRLLHDREQLRGELEAAVTAEEYEKAARIRDEMIRLESEDERPT